MPFVVCWLLCMYFAVLFDMCYLMYIVYLLLLDMCCFGVSVMCCCMMLIGVCCVVVLCVLVGVRFVLFAMCRCLLLGVFCVLFGWRSVLFYAVIWCWSMCVLLYVVVRGLALTSCCLLVVG